VIFPEPAGWEGVARQIAFDVAAELGDLRSVIEPWIDGTGTPAPSERYDENAFLATGALVVNAARAALALHDGHAGLGGPLGTVELLEPTLASVLLRSLEDVPSARRRLLPLGRSPASRASSATTATVEYVARTAARVVSK
jgi:hypothetical protein